VEVTPGVFQIKVPIPNNPLGFMNAYLIKSDAGSLLVDTGWNTDEAFDTLDRELREAGSGWQDLRTIVITHAHPDHYGLVGRLVKLTDAELVIHAIERAYIAPRYQHYDPLLEEMSEWLRINGVPEAVCSSLSRASMEVLGMVAVASPNRIVHGGECLRLSDREYEVMWTPGHSAGHICLYEKQRQLFFSGDHVLPRITPNVSMHSQSIGNPLADYLSSLRQIATLPVSLVLPAHGDVFTDLRKRIEEIERHHVARQQEILASLSSGPRTAFQVSESIRWSTGGLPFRDLPAIQMRMAVTETLAHLELLSGKGELSKNYQDGYVLYARLDVS
jgi:glyoxylase-like metal-dependent hydrolase (beta-lactamase superfamily II)